MQTHLIDYHLSTEWVYNEEEQGEVVDELKSGNTRHNLENTRTSTERKHTGSRAKISELHLTRPTYHQRLYKRSLSKTKRFHIDEGQNSEGTSTYLMLLEKK